MVDREPEIRAVFCEALEYSSPAAQIEYLDQACQGKPELRVRIEALLEAHHKAGSFFQGEQPLAATKGQTGAEQPGMKIGRYKLVHEIGHGGMGVVYMAVQKEPVRRKVALKIIKAGMDTKEVMARFEAERQALALMDHQCIAKVLDGGSTASGRPYFVMELVEGTPIHEYCDACRYTTRQRLELYIQVCQAVQHAHLKGVIHRDIKPSNILVTNYDDKVVPKVIDFGIAKAVHQQLTDESVHTHVSQLIGTPLYMSPEQSQRTGQNVDTRTDVYSLGVLLYELLTGTTPFDKERLESSGLDEFKQIIRKEEPPKPSARLSTLAAALETVVEKRQTNIRTLTRELSGELDWIVMKALEKDRTRRYESANELAKDVQRYLNDEAVEACPPSASYRFGKFARRNKAAVLTTITVFLALAVGAGLATWQSIRATWESQRATKALNGEKRQLERAEANLELAMQALDDLYLKSIGDERLLDISTFDLANIKTGGRFDQPLTGQRQPFTESERKLIQEGLSFYDQFVQQNAHNPEALLEAGKAYSRVAMLQAALDQNDEAQAACEEAIIRLTRLVDGNPTNAGYSLELGRAYFQLGLLSRWQPNGRGSFAKAEAALSRAIELDSKTASAYELRGDVCRELGKNQVADYERALELSTENANTHWKLFGTYSWGKHRNVNFALHHARKAVRLKPEDVEFRKALGIAYVNANDAESATAEFTRAIELAADNPQQQISLRVEMYRYLHDDRQLIESANQYKDIHKNTRMLYKRAAAHERLGEIDEALADLDACEKLSPNCWQFQSLKLRGEIRRKQGRFEEAADAFGRAIELSPMSHIYGQAIELSPMSHVYKCRAASYFQLGQYDRALADLAKAVELGPRDLSNLTFWIWPHLPAKCPEEPFRTGLLKLADKTVELTDKAAGAYATRGWILAAFGQEEKAIDDLTTACDLIPNDSELGSADLAGNCAMLRELCAELAHREETLQCLAGLIDRVTKAADRYAGEPEFRNALPELYVTLATMQSKRGKPEEALDAIRKAVDANPGNARASNRLAWMFATTPDAGLRDPQKAVELAKKACELSPSSEGYWNTLGVAQYRAESYQEALDALQKSIDSGYGGNSFDWFFLAMAHWRLNHKDEARQWYDKAVLWMDKYEPDNEQLLRFHAEAAELLGVTAPEKSGGAENTDQTKTNNSESEGRAADAPAGEDRPSPVETA
jgi:tetratricopeptide (TPR) repeat protein